MDNLLGYKNYLTVNGFSNSTIDNYIQRIKKLFKTVKIEELNEEEIIKFLLDMKDKYSISTINGYRNAFKSFLTFIKKDVPVPKIIKPIKKLPESFTEEFFKEKIIPVVEAVFTNPLKMKAILYFLFYSGLRVGEMETIKRENINLDERTVKFYMEKTKEERITIFNKETKNILQAYFTTELETINAFNITKTTLKQTISRMKPYFKEINIHPHLFRHSYATHLLSKGVDVSIVSKSLGHRSISSTIRYLKLDISLLKQKYDEKIK